MLKINNKKVENFIELIQLIGKTNSYYMFISPIKVGTLAEWNNDNDQYEILSVNTIMFILTQNRIFLQCTTALNTAIWISFNDVNDSILKAIYEMGNSIIKHDLI